MSRASEASAKRAIAWPLALYGETTSFAPARRSFISDDSSDARATMVVAAYSGAMAIAKVEQRGEPLRLCAKELERLL